MALMLHTGGMVLKEVFYSLVAEDGDLLLAESIKVKWQTSHSNGICFASLSSKFTKQLTNLYVYYDRNCCHVTRRCR